MGNIIKTISLLAYTCLLLSACLSSCKDDNDEEYEILEQRDDYVKCIRNKIRGVKGEFKDIEGWISLSPAYGWIASFRYDEEQIPSTVTHPFYLLSGTQEEYQCYKDQYAIINGKYQYIYSIVQYQMDGWVVSDFFELKYTDIKSAKE